MKEFYTIDDELWCTDGSNNILIDEHRTDIIQEIFDNIKSQYPTAYQALSREYSKSSVNVPYYKYLVVRRFCKCNFSTLDTLHSDIDEEKQYHFEKVSCPLRGECKLENIVCQPKIDSSLSYQERLVMELVYNGVDVSEIAERLYKSENTVKNQIKSSYKKLGVHNRAEFIILAKKCNMFNS